MENGPKRSIVCAFRGVGKSTLASFYLLWRLYHNPEEKCLILSASLQRSEAMSAWMLKTITDVPWLRQLAPDSHDGRYSRIAFDVGNCQHIEQSPSVRAAGVTGQVTGSRASIILADDVETVQTSLTQTQRERLRTVLNEAEVIVKPGPDSRVLYLGTPHSTTDSIYFALNRDLNYDLRLWPARVPEDLTPYKGCLAPEILKRYEEGGHTGRPTDTRFSEDELLQRELSMSSIQSRLQLQLDASLSDLDRFPLRCGDWMVITVDQYLPEVMVYEKHKAYQIDDLPCCGLAHDPHFYRPRELKGTIHVNDVPTVMACDPSGGGGDRFAYCVLKAHGGCFYVMDQGGKLGGVDDAWWKHLAMTAKKHGVNEIVFESNFGDVSIFRQVLLPYLRAIEAECRVESQHSSQRKEMRIIDTLAPVLQTHRLAIDRRVVEEDAKLIKDAKDERDVSYSLFYQLSRITYDRGSLMHDDQIDALAMAVMWFQQQAALSAEVTRRDRAKELLLASIEDSDGWALMNVQRQAMGMSLEQCQKAEGGGKSWGSWI